VIAHDTVRLARDLETWLAARLGREVDSTVERVVVSEVARPPAGQSSDTWLFRATWADRGRGRNARFVLKRQPSDNQLFLAADVLREARVLSGLASVPEVPVPRVIGTEPDPGVLGAPFFVMEHVEGRVPAGKPSIHAAGWLPTLTARERDRLWWSAMETLVAIHRVDWRASHAFLLDDGASAAAHLGRLERWYRWATDGRRFPITDAALAYLYAEIATLDEPEAVFVWGDARAGNMLFDDDGRVTAAIDWEIASIGPPAIDLARWCFFDEFSTAACGVERPAGWPDRATTIARYESVSGRSLANLEWFEMMDRLSMATTLIRQADRRVARGLAPPSSRMGYDNPVTAMLARQLGLPEPPTSPDYIAHRRGTTT
jgi:aminoglycoside phosphotransferase (APT) family kinase protein